MELKDVVHLYLNVPERILFIEKSNYHFVHQLCIRKGSTIVLTPLIFAAIQTHGEGLVYKLNLRLLSSMTEQEADYFAWLCMNNKHLNDKSSPIDRDEIQIELVPYDGGNMLDADIELYIGISCRCWQGYVAFYKDGSICKGPEDSEQREPLPDIAEKIRWLLTKRFDLFGLIPSGQAIDETEQPSKSIKKYHEKNRRIDR